MPAVLFLLPVSALAKPFPLFPPYLVKTYKIPLMALQKQRKFGMLGIVFFYVPS